MERTIALLSLLLTAVGIVFSVVTPEIRCFFQLQSSSCEETINNKKQDNFFVQQLPVEPSPVQPSPVQPSPVQPSPVQSLPSSLLLENQPPSVQPSPVQPSPVRPLPSSRLLERLQNQPPSVQPSPVQPSPVRPLLSSSLLERLQNQPPSVQPSPVQPSPVRPLPSSLLLEGLQNQSPSVQPSPVQPSPVQPLLSSSLLETLQNQPPSVQPSPVQPSPVRPLLSSSLLERLQNQPPSVQPLKDNNAFQNACVQQSITSNIDWININEYLKIIRVECTVKKEPSDGFSLQLSFVFEARKSFSGTVSSVIYDKNGAETKKCTIASQFNEKKYSCISSAFHSILILEKQIWQKKEVNEVTMVIPHNTAKMKFYLKEIKEKPKDVDQKDVDQLNTATR